MEVISNIRANVIIMVFMLKNSTENTILLIDYFYFVNITKTASKSFVMSLMVLSHLGHPGPKCFFTYFHYYVDY